MPTKNHKSGHRRGGRVNKRGRAKTGGFLGGLPRPVRLAFFVLFAYFLASICLQQIEVLSMAREVRLLEARVAELRRANDRLQEEIEYAQTDAFIEQVAREQLGLIGPNEVPYAPGVRTGP